jgi:hypothetical protein
MMRTMKTFTQFFIVLAGLAGILQAQDASFFHTNHALVSTNPSFAGSNGQLRYQASYSKDGARFSGAPVAYGSAIDFYSDKLKSGFAAKLSHYTIGPLQSSDVAFTYARYFSSPNDKMRLVPSVQLGVNRKILHNYWIVPGSGTTDLPVKYTSFTVGTGALLDVQRRLFLGAYLFNINRPVTNINHSVSLMRFALNGSYNFRISKWLAAQVTGFYENDNAAANYKTAMNFLFLDRIIAGIGTDDSRRPYSSIGYRNESFSILAGYCPPPPSYYLRSYLRGEWQFHAGFSLRKKVDRHTFVSFETM